jgi:hypothetical protein
VVGGVAETELTVVERLRRAGAVPPPERRLQRAAAVFAVAVAVHGADHVRRGLDAITAEVRYAGGLQFALTVVALVLVFRRHPAAPLFAIGVGFLSAIGFTAAHLLPHWSSFSDSFTGRRIAPGVDAFSWATALFEIGADIAFGWTGIRVLRSFR